MDICNKIFKPLCGQNASVVSFAFLYRSFRLQITKKPQKVCMKCSRPTPHPKIEMRLYVGDRKIAIIQH